MARDTRGGMGGGMGTRGEGGLDELGHAALELQPHGPLVVILDDQGDLRWPARLRRRRFIRPRPGLVLLEARRHPATNARVLLHERSSQGYMGIRAIRGALA